MNSSVTIHEECPRCKSQNCTSTSEFTKLGNGMDVTSNFRFCNHCGKWEAITRTYYKNQIQCQAVVNN